MSVNATAPIDITNNYDSTCDLKCKYSFKYPLSNLNITNKRGFLYITPENFNESPVTYNSNKYNVRGIRLYRKSLHTYGGKNADAELLIIHNNVNGSDILIVSIPIMIGSGNPKSSAIFDTIITEVAKTANSVGKQTSLNNVTFTLDQLIPMKPYFSYNGTLPFSPFNGTNSYIVYNIENAISMSSSAFDAFSNIIEESTSQTNPVKNGLYYNKKGPTYYSPSGKPEEIFIECLPTGSSGEVLIEKDKSKETVFNNATMKKIFDNKIFQGIFIALLIVFGLYMLKKIFSFILSSKGSKGGGSNTSGGNISGGNNKINSFSVGGGGGARLVKPPKS
jgi:carbonic anhydrase